MNDEVHDRLMARSAGFFRDNIARLGGQDIALATFPGAGKSIIATALRALRLNYVDAATEILRDDGSTVIPDSHVDYHERLDTPVADDAPPARPWPRFVKTHLSIGYLRSLPLRGVLVLVRDPRDTLYAYHRSLSEMEPDGLLPYDSWLESESMGDCRPGDVWKYVYSGQREGLPGVATVRFEDLKARPAATMSGCLEAFGVAASAADVGAAMEASSFERMRAHERTVLAAAGRAESATYFVRRGLIGEWREWMTPAREKIFREPGLWEVANSYGYRWDT